MDLLSIYTVYCSPPDFPGQYIGRRFEVHPGFPQPTGDYYCSVDLGAVREWIRWHSASRGFLADVCMPREPKDAPPVVESWL